MSPGVRGHGAVAGEVLPLLDAHAHVGAGVLLAGRARAWEEGSGRRRVGRKRETPQESTVRRRQTERERESRPTGRHNAGLMQKECTPERATACGPK